MTVLQITEIDLPRQERMIRMVLKHQDPDDGNFTACLQRRHDSVSDYFRPPPGFVQSLQFRATELAPAAASNVIEYCTILLSPESQHRIAGQRVGESQQAITVDRIR